MSLHAHTGHILDDEQGELMLAQFPIYEGRFSVMVRPPGCDRFFFQAIPVDAPAETIGSQIKAFMIQATVQARELKEGAQ